MILLINVFVSLAQGCPDVPLSGLDESQVLKFSGEETNDIFGRSVSDAGDINNDGIPDIVIGASEVDSATNTNIGAAYVVFGAPGITTSSIDISSLNGANGFKVIGTIADDKVGLSVSTAGDINEDGIDDVMIGTNRGVIIVFGRTTGFLSLYTRTDIDDGVTGIVLEDVDTFTSFGETLSDAGDVNNDGVDDIIIGASRSRSATSSQIGNAYVFFGSSTIASANVGILDGNNGFKIEGFLQTFSGRSMKVSKAGDLNNDGTDDLLLGYPSYDESGERNAGRVAVVFGSNTGFTSLFKLSLLDGSNGFYIASNQENNTLGLSVAAARDFNNDTIDDIIIATGRDQVYIMYGTTVSFPSSIQVSDFTSSTALVFRRERGYRNDVDGGTDINGDGISDVLIASGGGGPAGSGGVYVLYGGSTPPALLEDIQINGANGYQVFYDVRFNRQNFGFSVSNTGDFNNDGVNDFIVGENAGSSSGLRGNAHVFFGGSMDVFDVERPTITCPSGSQELYANSVLPNYVHFLRTVNDNCTYNMNLTFTQTPPNGSLFTSDTNVTVTVSDRSGNTNSCTFLVKLKTDTTEIDCQTTGFSINDINGSNGLVLYGEKAIGGVGYSVDTAGDVNGDGIDDFIVGAPGGYSAFSGPYGRDYIIIDGGAYVVYGTSSGFPPNIDLGLLDGANGFAIRNDTPSSNFPVTGYAVSSAGDLNGDGISDIMIGDPYRHSPHGRENGHTYIIFGKNTGFSADFKLSTLDGTNGFTIVGASNYENAGYDIDTVGDINNDSFTDIALTTAGSGGGSGKCYILYGTRSGFPALLRVDEINGVNGFTITGNVMTGEIGRMVAGLGDVNGDRIPDIGVGGKGNREFVIYGKNTSFPPTFDISSLDGTNGFIIENSTSALPSVSGIAKVGDINGDGLNDIAVNKSYILFGSSSIPPTMDLSTLDGTNGFNITDISGRDIFNYAGDFNNDGFDDYIYQSSNGGHIILYGKNRWEATISSTSLTASDGLKIYVRGSRYKSVGYAGDVNNDGIDDVVIGSSRQNGMHHSIRINTDPGFAYVIFGKEIIDTERPVITCPANQILASGNVLPDYTTLATATDNCDAAPVITQNPIAGSAYTPGMTITLTATDAKGNTNNCTFVVNEDVDTTPPSITCPSDQELVCNTSVIPDYTGLATATDLVDPSPVVTQSPVSGSAFVDGMIITMTATDASGNADTCRFVVNQSADTEDPVVTCPSDQNLSSGSTLPDYTGLVSVADNCDSALSIVQIPAVGSPFTSGMTVEFTATDVSGNIGRCSIIITTSPDTTPPSITCPSDQELVCNTSVIPDYTGLVTATDLVDPSPVVTQNPVSGSVFVDGMIITMTATDASGNADTCQFVVNQSADTEDPVVTCPSDQNLPFGSTLPDYTGLVSVLDNCDTTLSIVQTPAVGSPFTSGMTVEFTATDVSGNVGKCSIIITESPDTIPPSIICPSDQELVCNTSVIPDYTGLVTATDLVDPSPVVTQNPVSGSVFVDGMIITMTATDASGNADTCQFIVNQSADTEDPVVTCPSDQNLPFGSTLPDYTGLVSVLDNCDTTLSIVQTPAVGSPFTSGMTVEFTATDVSGNVGKCSIIITESPDTIPPSITCPSDQELSCDVTELPDYTQLVTVVDNQDSNPVITQTPAAGSPIRDGMLITISATDSSANNSNCAFMVFQENVLVEVGEDEEIIDGQEVQLSAVSSKSGTFVWEPSIGLNNSNIANPIAKPNKTTTYTVLFTSDKGCVAEDTVTIYVEEQQEDQTRYGFSPDGDGINEYWEIYDIENYPNNKVSIYNRWGDIVFEVEGYNNTSRVFRGIANRKRSLGGDELPEGTYFFDIKIEGSHNLRKQTGFLVLKR
ncbi:HYR domain-containing protein [Aquimarina sediminis]|uniref:HYR domain-containing protein n=1 Tax=Aquimarina sediminis TaxID=2070536 RepID=UPI0019D44379|nr:HYR domain-containing protein [Aquimarina sediminis]